MNGFPIFPEGFRFGVATSAYQIEGAWNEDGKGESIWDRFCHTRGKIKSNDTGDIACDHYHRFKDDIKLMKSLGIRNYRFSISWPRIYPSGTGSINRAGLDFYSGLVDELLENGITPLVTLYHWDLPMALQERGGWGNRDCAGWFADYAKTVANCLGDRVEQWITLNEPWMFIITGNLLGYHAPGIRNPWVCFRAVHHALLAHAQALLALKAECRDAEVGITLSLDPVYPQTSREKDLWAAEMADEAYNRLFLDPLFKGEYPRGFMNRIRLFKPKIQAGDMEAIRTPMDFLGINTYSRIRAHYAWYIPFLKFWIDGMDIPDQAFVKDGVQYTSMGQEVYPDCLYEILTRLRTEYGNPKTLITENGAGFTDVVKDGAVHDPLRIDYLKQYLGSALKAVKEGANLKGYFFWSLLDNFEWAEGYCQRIGLIRVDYRSQTRIIKDSAYWYADLIRANTARQWPESSLSNHTDPD